HVTPLSRLKQGFDSPREASAETHPRHICSSSRVKAIPEPIEISEGSNETGESRVIGGGSFRTDDRMPLNGRPISSPKRDGHAQTSWEKFFPYYAGFPEAFASDVLEDLKLKPGATVLDPW